MSEPDKHWLIWDATRWGCTRCGWHGKRVQDFWEAHKIKLGDIPF